MDIGHDIMHCRYTASVNTYPGYIEMVDISIYLSITSVEIYGRYYSSITSVDIHFVFVLNQILIGAKWTKRG